MKQIITLIIFSIIIFSCKKEIPKERSEHYLQKVKSELKDSLSANDYSTLDFSKAVFNKVDSVGLYFLRIPFKEKRVATDFVLLKTTKDGKVEQGKIIHLEGKVNAVGNRTRKQRQFDGRISISDLSRKSVLNSNITDGYIDALHMQTNTRDQLMAPVYPDNVLPEVVVVAYVHNSDYSDFSTWLWLSSLFYSYGTGGGYGGGGGYYGGYYGSTDGGGGYYYGGGGGGGSYGDYEEGGTSVIEDETMLVDIDTYVDNPAIDVGQYLKCFDNIPDDGATCTITIYTDIPVDNDPSKLFNWQTRSPGHAFLELKKSNGTRSVQQSIGFYPTANWKNILSADPVDSKIVNDGNHEFNASLKMIISPNLLRSAIGKIKEISNMKYDMDEFNCTDFALEVFNYIRTPLQIPHYVIPGGVYRTNTPQGLYNKLKDMWLNNDAEKNNITIDILKGYVGSSSGPCN